MTRPPAFITSVRVEPSTGPHEYVSVWIRGQKVGTLCVGKGDGNELELILTGRCSRCADDGQARCPAHRKLIENVRIAPPAELREDEPAKLGPVDEGTPVQSDAASDGLPFVMKGALSGAPRLRPPGPWSTHQREWPLSAGLKQRLSGEPCPPHRSRITLGAGVDVAPEDPPTLMDPGPNDPRVRAQGRISRALQASLRADEQERRKP